MKILHRLILSLLLVWFMSAGEASSADRDPLRIAVVTPDGEGGEEVEAELRRLIGGEQRVAIELIDRDLTRLARDGGGFEGGLNLSLEEARGLGQALGADFFILGRVFSIARSAEAGFGSLEGLAALFLVESRTGRLRRFQQAATTGADATEVKRRLPGEIAEVWEVFFGAITEAAGQAAPFPPMNNVSAHREVYTDEGQWGEGRLRPPLFQRQLKPAYPPTAARVEVEATIELMAVFRPDGEVDQIEVQKWGGFGLEESAVATVRLLRFRPATLDGQPVSFRGLVRYNFRRPAPQAIRSATKSQEEIDRLKRSLNDLLKIRPVP
ncbi:MAG: energy transducer TonB [Acidobacteria bacterium]|nr:energy transducer TonB [Acidobacteriota bacterium]